MIAAHFLGFSAVLAACCPPKPYPPHVETFLALLKPVADRAERSSQTSKTWPTNSQAKAHEAHDVRKRVWERDPRDRCLTQRVHDLLKADHGEIGQSDGIGGFASSRRLLHGFLAVAIERFISFPILVERICRGN